MNYDSSFFLFLFCYSKPFFLRLTFNLFNTYKYIQKQELIINRGIHFSHNIFSFHKLKLQLIKMSSLQFIKYFSVVVRMRFIIWCTQEYWLEIGATMYWRVIQTYCECPCGQTNRLACSMEKSLCIYQSYNSISLQQSNIVNESLSIYITENNMISSELSRMAGRFSNACRQPK